MACRYDFKGSTTHSGTLGIPEGVLLATVAKGAPILNTYTTKIDLYIYLQKVQDIKLGIRKDGSARVWRFR